MTHAPSKAPAREAGHNAGLGGAFHAARAARRRFRLDLGRSLKMHGGLAFGIALMGIALTGAYLLRFWPVYSAKALVYIQPAPEVQTVQGTVMHWPYNYDPATYESYVQQQMLSMTRSDVLKAAVSKVLGFQKSGESDQEAVERLGRAVTVAREGNSFEVGIEAVAGKAQTAAEIANAVAASYIEYTSREQRERDSERIGVLRQEVDRVKKELGDDRAKQGGSDLNAEIARLQGRYDNLDAQIQNLEIEDASPGTAHLTAAAMPVGPVADGVVPNAGILLSTFCLLALLAAVIAHKLDPRLYIASDVEQILGFAPIAELPDFSEVSEEVCEEQLLRLATAIESGFLKDNFKSCVFTGSGPRTGVTTIAGRVRSLMEGIGRRPVLVDSLGAESAVWPSFAGSVESELAHAKPLALIQRLTDEQTRDGMVVLVDAAPLTISAETEYLVLNTNCVIVVLESGSTTRAELRATIRALRRLDTGAVAFVLNRVTLAKADAPFRDSLRAMEGSARLRTRRMEKEPVRTRRVEPEFAPGPTQPAPEPVKQEAKPPQDQESVPLKTREEKAPPEADTGPISSPAPTEPVRPRPAVEQRPPVVRPSGIAPQPSAPERRDTGRSMPWWLTDPLVKPEAAGEAPQVEPEPPPVEEAAPPDQAVRLSALRRLFSERNAARPEMPAVPRPTGPTSAPSQASRPLQPQPVRVPSISEKVAVQRGREAISVPTPEAEASAPQEAPPRRGTPEVLTVPEFLPPRKTGSGKREEDAASRRDRRDTWDEVSVLPSWRGQYRRKE